MIKTETSYFYVMVTAGPSRRLSAAALILSRFELFLHDLHVEIFGRDMVWSKQKYEGSHIYHIGCFIHYSDLSSPLLPISNLLQ